MKSVQRVQLHVHDGGLINFSKWSVDILRNVTVDKRSVALGDTAYNPNDP